MGPFVGALAVAAAALYRPLYRLLTNDDRLFEWLQVAVGVAAVGFGVAVAISLWRHGQRVPAAFWAAFALGCFFVTGEEISWAQRFDSNGNQAGRRTTTLTRYGPHSSRRCAMTTTE